ncbi:DNA topoisomerase 2-binding protein 1 [Cydia splendana]|uniref:DNA topoisomerase 2-binding protein 1 n=1 Tax=Cydia splendana TaxID=1100963 RepID=UPI00300CDEBE
MTDVKIKVTFVIPKHCSDENDCSEDMLIAYTACENHRGGGLQAQWAHEKSLTFDQPPMKNDIFVLSEFEGDLYEKLKATKCLLVGPRCLSCSLTEGSPIPSKGHPVYTVAMRGLIVTLSGLSKEAKTNLKQKIEWMGGTYSAVLSSETTHLIANNVFSDKYIKAAERGIPVMKDSWIPAVWDASLKLDINGSSPEFNAHRLPPFANLQITTSGLNSHDKKLIMKLVNANGGEFSRVFLSQTTDVLVLTKDSTSSEKYKAAIEFGKVCVTPHWIKDSAALGFALPVSRYKVTSTTTSSPVRDLAVPDMSLNLTRITKEGKPSNFVDESKMTDSMMLSGTTKFQESKRDSNVDENQKAFEAFDVAAVKKAGPIFDGFCIWVSGLDGMPRERAWACVSKAGGTRYDGPNSRVTHAVSWGAAASAAAAALPTVPVLSPLWLIRSVEAGRVLDEAEFLINTEPATPRKASQPPIAAPSPMSKRTLQLLLPPPEPIVEEQPQRDHIVDHYLSRKLRMPNVLYIRPLPMSKRTLQLLLPPPDPIVEEQPQRDHIVDHYLSQHLSQQQAAESSKSPEPEPEKKEPSRNNDDTAVTVSGFTQSENIFKDLVFEVQGLEDEAICEIGAEIRAEGGMLAAAGAGGTHVLVPLDFDNNQLVTKSAEAVTVFWVKDCLSRQELTPIEYYHRPVHLKSPASNPLHGVVASLSTYSGVERAFLDELAKLCGAAMQQRFCRRSNNSALASTHLVCPEPTGAKYTAARKWGVPVVRASWLLACAERGVRVDEAEHSVDQEAADPSHVQQNTLNAPPQTPEPKKSIPLPEERIPEPKANTPEITEPKPKTPEPEIIELKTPEPKRTELNKTPEPDLDANMVPDVEQTLPPDVGTAMSPRQTKKKFKINTNKNEQFEGMSPASRFIAMRRMGMFSDHEDSSKENTPKRPDSESDNEVLSSPNLKGFSPNTRRKLQAIRRGEIPDEPIKTPNNPFDKKIPTPDSDFGAALRPGRKRMSVDARKLLWEFVDGLPTNESRSDTETPPSKMAKFTEDQCAGGARIPDVQTTPLAPKPVEDSRPSVVPLEVDEQLQRLNVVLTGRRTPRRASRVQPLQEKPADMEYESGPESQPNTVGWDDTTPSQKESFESSKPHTNVTLDKSDKTKSYLEPIGKDNEDSKRNVESKENMSKVEVNASNSVLKVDKAVEAKREEKKTIRRFMLSSNVDNREETVEMILRLGGSVTDLDDEDSAPPGTPATHLLCCAPARSQRVLNCIASGCWVLHPAYVARSAAHGTFLPEENFEWGNPVATCLPPVTGGERVLALAAHRWRTRRAWGQPGPFAGVIALLHAPEQRRKLLARLVKAGEGSVVDEEPPYTDETINVCFADPKRYPMKERDRAWLVSRRVPVCASILLSAFLTEENRPDLNQHCLPEFRQ